MGLLESCLQLILLYVQVRGVVWCGVEFRVELRIYMDGRGDYEAALRRLCLCLLFSFVLLSVSFSTDTGTTTASLSLSLSLQHCGA